MDHQLGLDANAASGGSGLGGAVYNDSGSMRLNGDTSTGNTVTYTGTSTGRGGGALDTGAGPVAIDNSAFTSNSESSTHTDDGGGALTIEDEVELTNEHLHGELGYRDDRHWRRWRGDDGYGLNSVVTARSPATRRPA